MAPAARGSRTSATSRLARRVVHGRSPAPSSAQAASQSSRASTVTCRRGYLAPLKSPSRPAATEMAPATISCIGARVRARLAMPIGLPNVMQLNLPSHSWRLRQTVLHSAHRLACRAAIICATLGRPMAFSPVARETRGLLLLTGRPVRTSLLWSAAPPKASGLQIEAHEHCGTCAGTFRPGRCRRGGTEFEGRTRGRKVARGVRPPVSFL